jgi:TPR repeat protein
MGLCAGAHTLGLASQEGSFGPKDIRQALAYFTEAAQAGYAPAHCTSTKAA